MAPSKMLLWMPQRTHATAEERTGANCHADGRTVMLVMVTITRRDERQEYQRVRFASVDELTLRPEPFEITVGYLKRQPGPDRGEPARISMKLRILSLCVVLGVASTLAMGCPQPDREPEASTAVEPAAEPQAPPQVQEEPMDEIRVVNTSKDDGAMIRTTERFDVLRGEERIGTIEMSSRGTYGVKPRVKAVAADETVVFEGLWEEQFTDYDDLPEAIARLFVDGSKD